MRTEPTNLLQESGEVSTSAVRSPLHDLLRLLRMEQLEENLFRGESSDFGYGAVFGGHVLAQALSAASRTVSASRRAHSVHAHFLRAGDMRAPILYRVDPLGDGSSFTMRHVRAVQGERPIFSLTASFHVEEAGYEHQAAPPSAAGPEGLKSELELLAEVRELIPEELRRPLLAARPIEVRPVDGFNWLEKRARPAVSCRWVRAAGSVPDDPALHRCLVAYASDLYILGVSLYPHGASRLPWQPGVRVASLNHALWFHREFRLDDWLLYVVESPNASGARGLAMGRIYTRSGKLVASVAQEGLIREEPLDAGTRSARSQ